MSAPPTSVRLAKPLAAHPAGRGVSEAHPLHTPSLDVSVPPAAARAKLVGIRDEIERRANLGERPVVVFDIDDTLLTWETPGHPQTLVPGALGYVNSLKSAGATIVYMTGRRADMRGRTENELRKFGFPLGTGEVLLLNDSGLETVAYKAAATRVVVRTLGTPIAAFDNERENVRMFRRELPDGVSVVCLRTTTIKPDPGGKGHVVVIDDYSSVAQPDARTPERSGQAVDKN
jgi:hypothetical protein